MATKVLFDPVSGGVYRGQKRGYMTETLIVDGYNIIYAIPEIENELNKDLISARNALEAALRVYRAAERSIRRIYVVYDGKGESGLDIEDKGIVKNVYTAKNTSADIEIVNILKKIKNTGKAAVLSMDNFVINHARAMGADVLPINVFYKKAAKKSGSAAASGLSESEKDSITKELKKIWRIE